MRREFRGHTVATTFEMGWSALGNGELLKVAELEFEVFVTTDQSLRFQQNLAGRRLAILVLPTTNWPRIQAHVAEVVAALEKLREGELRELTF